MNDDTQRTPRRRRRSPQQAGAFTYQVPLRPDFVCQFVLPRDLTKGEAARIAAILAACVIPDTAKVSTARLDQTGVDT